MTMATGSTDNPVDARRAELVAMFQSLIRKAQKIEQAAAAETHAINLIFDGSGTALTVGMGGIVEIPYPCRIVGCRMMAGITSVAGVSPIPTTATVWLGVSAGTDGWDSGVFPIFGAVQPTLSHEAEATIAHTAWDVLELQPYDAISYTLTSFIGTATVMTLALLIRKVDATGLGSDDLFSGSDRVVSGSSNVVLR